MKKKMTYTVYDAADYLKTEADMAGYFQAVLEESGNDPVYISKALGNIARARSMTKVAKKAGMTREGLYKALSGTGNPEFATILKVIDALGLRLQAVAK